MHGVAHHDAIETVVFRHEQGNEGVKIVVKWGYAAFSGSKLLKRQGDAPRLLALVCDLGVTWNCRPGLTLADESQGKGFPP
jgi:hypothetical protein